MKRNSTPSLLLFWLVFLPAGGPALAQNQNLTLEEAVRQALSNDPVLRQAEHEVQAAQSRVKSARSTYFPQIDSGGIAKQGLSGSGNLFGLHGLASSPDPDDLAASGNLFQNIFDFGRTKHASSARAHEFSYLAETARAVRAGVILDVNSAFYGALSNRDLVEAARQSLEEKKLTARQTQAFYRAQLRSKVDLELAQVDLSRAELELVRAQNDLKASIIELKESMGLAGASLDYMPVKPQIDPAPPLALEDLVRFALENRPELRALEFRIQAEAEWVEKAESERFPIIMGMFSGGITRFADLTLGKLLFGGFGIRMPVFTGGRLEADIEEAKQNLAKAEAQHDQMIQEIHLRVEQAYHSLNSSIEEVEATRRLVSHAEEALRLARVRYRMDLGDFVELTAAQSALTSARADLARSLYDYKIREAELKFAAGELR